MKLESKGKIEFQLLTLCEHEPEGYSSRRFVCVFICLSVFLFVCPSVCLCSADLEGRCCFATIETGVSIKKIMI